MNSERIWVAGYMVFMVLMAIGFLINDNWENRRIEACEARGHEWRVVKDQGWRAPIMGCVAPQKKEAA